MNGGDQCIINRTIKIQSESLVALHMTTENKFGHHMIGDGKLFVVVGLVMENLWLPQDWGPRFFGHHTCDNNFFAIVDLATVEIFQLLILWQ
jgi:hypothetical protein